MEFEFLFSIDDKIYEFVHNEMIETTADKLGLDPRAGSRFYVSENIIAINIAQDRILKYYGGFEYVNDVYRREYGDYIFYLGDCDRVRKHLDKFHGIVRKDPDEEDSDPDLYDKKKDEPEYY